MNLKSDSNWIPTTVTYPALIKTGGEFLVLEERGEQSYTEVLIQHPNIELLEQIKRIIIEEKKKSRKLGYEERATSQYDFGGY